MYFSPEVKKLKFFLIVLELNYHVYLQQNFLI